MATRLQPAAPYLTRYFGNFIRAIAMALAAVPVAVAQAQQDVQATVEMDSLKSAAPKNFIMHETPEPGVVLRFEDSEARLRSLVDYHGRIVLLNVWATWCPPCVKEIPALDRLVAALNDADVVVVAVSVDRKGIDAVRKAFADLGVQKLAPYVDRSGQALRTVRAMGLPTSLLIDRDGRELGRIVGPAAWDDDATVGFFRQVAAPPGQTGRRYGSAEPGR
jgi:thiol-disulfide isomerase/thioredoxin